MAKAFYIRINKAKVFLSEFHLRKDEIRLEQDMPGDSVQCEGCSSDIIEKGEKVEGRQKIRCDYCGRVYDIHEEKVDR